MSDIMRYVPGGDVAKEVHLYPIRGGPAVPILPVQFYMKLGVPPAKSGESDMQHMRLPNARQYAVAVAARIREG